MKHILISYDYFFPGYRAGGPIQSLVNLVNLFQKEYKVSIFTSVYDLNEQEPYLNIKINDWNKIYLLDASDAIDVYYADTKKIGFKEVKEVIQFLKPDIIYINSIYSLFFLIYPLLVIRKLSLDTEIIICPRGMLQSGALQVKALKKKIFLNCFKISGLLNRVCWHATNEEEKGDIIKCFPVYKKISVASNIPKIPISKIINTSKKKGELKLVYLSLISEKKNLHLLLQVLNKVGRGITLDIYGPIKDENYWKVNCLPLLERLVGRVSYKGDIQPIEVQHKLMEYDALILLTKGENFGHALYESLSVGRPIITSNYTPWMDLELKNAGWNVDIGNLQHVVELINTLSNLDNDNFELYTKGAYNLAVQYYYNQNFISAYKDCFNSDD